MNRGPPYSACTRVGRWQVDRYSKDSPCRTRLQSSKVHTNAYRAREQSWSKWWLTRCGMRSRTTSEWTRRECAGRNGRGEVSAWGGRLSRRGRSILTIGTYFASCQCVLFRLSKRVLALENPDDEARRLAAPSQTTKCGHLFDCV